MKLKDSREAYYTSSAKTSDLVRQLSFAGFAIIWIFRINDQSDILPDDLVIPTLFLSITLILDLFQYLYKSILWGSFSRLSEKKYHKLVNSVSKEDFEIEAKDWFNWPTNFFYYTKILVMLIGYIYLFKYIINVL